MRPRTFLATTGLVASALVLMGAGPETFTDDFSSGISSARWELRNLQGLYNVNDVGSEVRFSKPVGGQYAFQSVELKFRDHILGDFDARIDFRDASIDRVDGSPGNQVQLNTLFGGQGFHVIRADEVVNGHNQHVWVDPPRATKGTLPNTSPSGTLRIARTGNVVTGYFNDIVIWSDSYNAEPARLWLSLQNNGTRDATAVTFDNFSVVADGLEPVPDPQILTDDFSGGISSARWELRNLQGLYDVDDASSEVRFSKPVGGQYIFQSVELEFGHQVLGDFEARIDFRDASIDRVDGSPGNQIQLNALFGGQAFSVIRGDEVGNGHNHHVWVDPPGAGVGTQSNAFTFGTLRIARTGKLVTGYFNGTAIWSGDYNGEPVRLWISLQNNGTKDATAVTFDDFYLEADGLEPPLPPPPPVPAMGAWGAVALALMLALMWYARLRTRATSNSTAS